MMGGRAFHRGTGSISNAEPEIRVARSGFAARPFAATRGRELSSRALFGTPSRFSRTHGVPFHTVGDFAPMARDRE